MVPSIASLVKDESILRLVSNMSTALDPSRWQVLDHWEADLFAIGIASAADKERHVYVSTRNQQAKVLQRVRAPDP